MEVEYIEYTTQQEIAKAFSIIESNQLYLQEEDGHSYNIAKRYSGICKIIDNPEYYRPIKITLAKIDNIFVGCSMSVEKRVHMCNTATYVKSEYRRQGIGSKLVTLAMPPERIENFQHPSGFPKVS